MKFESDSGSNHSLVDDFDESIATLERYSFVASTLDVTSRILFRSLAIKPDCYRYALNHPKNCTSSEGNMTAPYHTFLDDFSMTPPTSKRLTYSLSFDSGDNDISALPLVQHRIGHQRSNTCPFSDCRRLGGNSQI